jgi:hypothetical protein
MTTSKYAQARGLTRLAALLVMCLAGTAAAQGFPYEANESTRYRIDLMSLPFCWRVDCGSVGAGLFVSGPEIWKLSELRERVPELDERTIDLQYQLMGRLEERHVERVFALNAAIAARDPGQVREALDAVHEALALELEEFPEESFEGLTEGGLLLCLDEDCLERLPPGVRPYATVVSDLDVAELLAGRLPWESPRHLPRVWPPCITVDCGWTGPALFGRGPGMERLPQLMEHLPELDDATLSFQAVLFTALEERHQEEVLSFRHAVASRDAGLIHDALVRLDAAVLEEVSNMEEMDMSGAAEGGAMLCYESCDGIPPWILPYVRRVNELDLGGLRIEEVLVQLTH